MRRRMIDPDFWVDDKLAELSYETRLVFIATWSYADDEGFYEENYKKMKAVLFSYDNINIKKNIELLIKKNRTKRYTLEGINYHKIVNFKKYQTISHPTPSKIRKTLENSGVFKRTTPQDKLS